MKTSAQFPQGVLVSALVGAAFSFPTYALAAEDSRNALESDAWLDGKVETVLLLNANLNSFTIDTQVTDGVVLLTGEVESNVDRRLAEELTESVEGVRSVQNKLSVENQESLGEKINRNYVDAKISTVVKTRLLLDREITGTDIDVSSKDGTIFLRGFVGSSAEKDLAEAIARNTVDVEKVVNKLKVAG